MSTRTQIVVEGNEKVKIYKHSDGYPSGVLPTLQKLLPLFQKNRGFDPEYLTAHISYAFIQESIDSMREYRKEFPNRGGVDEGPSFTGHGLDTQFHSDIEYLYRVNKDFSVDVMSPVSHDSSLPTAKIIKHYTLAQLVKAKTFKD